MITIIHIIFKAVIKKDIEFYNGNNNNIQDIFMFGMDILGILNIAIHTLGTVFGVVGIMRTITTQLKILTTIIITNIVIGIDKFYLLNAYTLFRREK
jgi:hypothetical protein